MAKHLNLKELAEPAYYTAAVYELVPDGTRHGSWRFKGYLPTFHGTWGAFAQKQPKLSVNRKIYEFRWNGRAWEQLA